MMSTWTETVTVNEWTGDEYRAWRKSTYTASGHKVFYEVYELEGRYYWGAKTLIAHRPDLTRFSYGTIAVTPYSLGFAKAKATRIGKSILEAAKTPRHLTRAA